MTTVNDKKTFQRFELDLLNVAATHGISKDEFSVLTQPQMDVIVASLQAEIVAWKPAPAVRLGYPAGVWQMFKACYFPKWLKEKLPVKYHEERFEAVQILGPVPDVIQKIKALDGASGFIKAGGSGESPESD